MAAAALESMRTQTDSRSRLRAIALRPRFLVVVIILVIPLVLALRALERTPSYPVILPAIHFAALNAPPAPLGSHMTVLRIEPGDTLDSILTAGGLSRQEAYEVVQDFRGTIDPRRLRPGEIVRFRKADDGSVASVDMKITGWGRILAERSGDEFTVEPIPADDVAKEIVVSSTIDSSLYESIREAGQSPLLVQPMVDVFQWDIDFFRLREGDSFSVVVDKKWVGDDFVGYGPIKAARFVHMGKTYEAFRYTVKGEPAGYYSRDGAPLRKQFLKAPLRFTRITSGFTNRRFHPVLHTWRAHPAIDYGAPTGTPVMATADGIVTVAGHNSANGNYIKLRHTGNMETYYLHLSRFRKGIRKGARVDQGQIIGYVGSTGLANAPHLDYRVKRNGKYLNPLKLRSVSPDPLPKSKLAGFREQIERFFPILDGESTTVRMASDDAADETQSSR